MTTYRIDIPADADAHMRGPWVQTLLGAVGAQLDVNAETVLFGRIQANPWAGSPPALLADGRPIQCEPFVLPIHGQQRGIPLYPTEGVLSQRLRCADWWRLRATRGTFPGIYRHMAPYFADAVAAGFSYPAVDFVFQTNEATPAAIWTRFPAGRPGDLTLSTPSILRVSPSNFNFDGRPALRCRWWCFIRMAGTGFDHPLVYGGGAVYGGGGVYGAAGLNPFSAARAHDVAQMVNDWKGAGDWLNGVAVIWTPGAVDPSSSPTQDADGRWILPNGVNTWAGLADPNTGKATRPLGVRWILEENAP